MTFLILVHFAELVGLAFLEIYEFHICFQLFPPRITRISFCCLYLRTLKVTILVLDITPTEHHQL